MNFILIFLIAAVLQWVGPWWLIALVPFLIIVWRGKDAKSSFFEGFLAIGTLWFVYGLYQHIHSDGAISNRISEIFGLPNGLILLLFTTLIGAIVGGTAALAGLYLQKIFENPSSTSYGRR
jgi:hypothetical protein